MTKWSTKDWANDAICRVTNAQTSTVACQKPLWDGPSGVSKEWATATLPMPQCATPFQSCPNGRGGPGCALTPDQPRLRGLPGCWGSFLWPIGHTLAVIRRRIECDDPRSSALVSSAQSRYHRHCLQSEGNKRQGQRSTEDPDAIDRQIAFCHKAIDKLVHAPYL